MRDIIIVLFILIAIFGGGICTENYLKNTSDDVSNKLEKLKQNTIIAKQTENREEIKKEIDNIKKEWEEISKWWSIIVVHQEIDTIENALIKAKLNVEEGKLEDALQEIETAKFFVKHVRERERVSLKNIF